MSVMSTQFLFLFFLSVLLIGRTRTQTFTLSSPPLLGFCAAVIAAAAETEATADREMGERADAYMHMYKVVAIAAHGVQWRVREVVYVY